MQYGNDLTWHWFFLATVFRSQKYTSLLEIGVAHSRLADLAGPVQYVGVDLASFPRVTHRMASSEFWAQCHDKFDLIFIDGDHRYPTARDDVLQAMRHLQLKGLIACHDTAPRSKQFTTRNHCADSYKLQELSEKGWSRVTLHRHPGLTLFSKDDPPRFS